MANRKNPPSAPGSLRHSLVVRGGSRFAQHRARHRPNIEIPFFDRLKCGKDYDIPLHRSQAAYLAHLLETDCLPEWCKCHLVPDGCARFFPGDHSCWLMIFEHRTVRVQVSRLTD